MTTVTSSTSLPSRNVPHAAPARGVLVCGPPRCSQSLIATALAQHPACSLVLDSTWAIGVGRSVLATRNDLVDAAGRGIPVASAPDALAGAARLAVRTLTGTCPLDDRWVSWATVTGPGDVAVLAAMFPDAVIVAVVHDPDAAVESLATKACGDGLWLDRAAGYDTWRSAMQALLDAHRAWPDRVRLLSVADVHDEPARALGSCLAPMGLRWEPACGAPLAGACPVDVLASAARTAGPVRSRDAALELHATLSPLPSRTEPDAAARARLADALIVPEPAQGADEGSPLSRYRAFVALAVPRHAVAAVVSKGDPRLVDLPGRVGVHVMAAPDGTYLGHHPLDGAAAIEAVESARARGARFLVVPGASAWWLKHYDDLATHLEASARLVARHADIATVYELHVPA